MIPQTPLCVADRNTYWVRKLFCKNELLAEMCLADRVPLMARRAKSGICRNFGAESAHSGKIALTVWALSCHSPRDNLTATTRTKLTRSFKMPMAALSWSQRQRPISGYSLQLQVINVNLAKS